MAVVYRLVKALHQVNAFDGEGARRYGGRWNSKGVAIVYTSESRALAALETLAHIDRTIPFEWVVFRCEFPNKFVKVLDHGRLPSDWRTASPSPLRKLGDEWVREKRSAILRVPSVLIPEESNYLVNPNHPDYSAIKISAPEPFSFDPRL